MADSSKGLWWVLVLVVAGVALFLFSLQGKPQSPQSVSLQEVFKQRPAEGQKDPVPSPAIVTNPENGHEAGFAVQVYSFQDRSRADKALAQLKEAGYKAFMEVSDLGAKGTWYRVRIGSLENETQAKAMLEEIRKNYKSGFIVKPKI